MLHRDRFFCGRGGGFSAHWYRAGADYCLGFSGGQGFYAGLFIIGYLEKPVSLAFRGTLRDLSIGVGG